MQTARDGSGHEIGDKLCLVHNTVDVLRRVVQQLRSMFDGGVLDEFPATGKQVAEEQGEDHRDDEHDEQAKAQREVLADVWDESFHELTGSLMS